MRSIQWHLEAFASMWQMPCPGNFDQLENRGQGLVHSLSSSMFNLGFFDNIPSALRGLPVLSVFAFVAWGTLVRKGLCAEAEKPDLSAVRAFLNEVVSDMKELFCWTDDRHWETKDLVDDSMRLLTCFVDCLPFGVVFDGRREACMRGFAEETHTGTSFSIPDENLCYYHDRDRSWIESMRRLTKPNPESSAIMVTYLMDKEVYSASKETDHLPAAYRGCMINGVLMLRCVALQGLLMAFYDSLLPLIEELCGGNDCYREASDALDHSVRPVLVGTLQLVLLFSDAGTTFCSVQKSILLNYCIGADEASEVSSNGTESDSDNC